MTDKRSDDLKGCRVAVIATDGVEEVELTQPVNFLKEQGAEVYVIAPHSGEIQAFRHHDKSIRIPVDQKLSEVSASDYDGVVLPGGALNADQIRVVPEMKNFLREYAAQNRPLAAICHAPWSLISADLVRGRTLTSYHTLADDVRNAGGEWVDEQACVDENWVTSRNPDDLAAFTREMKKLFTESRRKQSAA